MGYTAGYNFDVSNLDSDFYKKLSAGTPINNPYATVSISNPTNLQIQNALNSLNDLYLDDGVKVVIKVSEITASKTDSRDTPVYHVMESPVLIDHPVAERLVIEGIAPSDHSILGVSYYDATRHGSLAIGGQNKYTGAAAASADGFYAQLIISNGNSLKLGEYLAVYDNRYQKYLNPSFYQFRDELNGRVFTTPYPVTAEKLRSSLIVGVHQIMDKIDLDERRDAAGNLINIANPGNKVDYVTVWIRNNNPTYTIGLEEYTVEFARRAYLTPQGVVGRYEQGYGSSTVLEDPLFFSGMSAGISAGADASSIPGYRNPREYSYGVPVGSGQYFTYFTSTPGEVPEVTRKYNHSPIGANRQGLLGMYVDEGSTVNTGNDWERYERLAQLAAIENAVTRNYRDSNDYRAKGFKSIIRCKSDGFIIANNNKPPLLKNILLLSESGGTGHGIRVDNSSAVNLQQVAIVGFSNGAGVFANNKSTVNIISEKFSDPDVFREVGVFSSCNYTGFEARNHSNINAPRSVATGNRFANFYASENSYINAYAAFSSCSFRYGIVAVGKSFINADSSFSCLNGSDGYFCSNGSLLTINSGRACYNYGNGIHAFSAGEIRAFDVITSSNKKDGIVANDSSTIICGDSAKEPIEWDLYFGYEEPYYNFESPTNISQSRFNGISGLAASTDSFINASFFETYDNSRIGGELGRLKNVDCVVSNASGYCFKGNSAGSLCDATYYYCDDARYDTGAADDTTEEIVSDLLPNNLGAASICIPYTDAVGATAQIPVSPSRYQLVWGRLQTDFGDSGLTIGKILACKGYLPGCGVFSDLPNAPSTTSQTRPVCTPNRTITEILQGASGSAQDSFYLNTEAIACTGDSSTLLLNTICVSSGTAYRNPLRPLSLILPNYDVEIRDSSKIAFAGRIANFGYYDIRTGVRIQPLYRGSGQTTGLLKPATLIGYSGNKNGSELVITDQTLLETGIFGDQGASSLDPRDARYGVRYSSEDFLSAAELYDPVAQIGFVQTSTYINNLGKTDPETGALVGTIGATATEIVINNTSNTPQDTTGTNEQSSGTGYPTY